MFVFHVSILGRWIEDHEVVHNLMYNTTTNVKIPYKQTLKRSEWWDNGVLPLWITAQNQASRIGPEADLIKPEP